MYCKVIMFSILIFLFSLLSYRRLSLIDEIQQIANSRVILPLSEMEHIKPRNSIDSYNSSDSSFIFVAYYDSLECLSCRMSQIGKWNSVIQKVNNKFEVKFYFIISPTLDKYSKTIEAYSNSRFLHDIYLDKNHAFERENPFLKNPYFHFLLMNSDNRVLYLGNPLSSEESEQKLLSALQIMDLSK